MKSSEEKGSLSKTIVGKVRDYIPLFLIAIFSVWVVWSCASKPPLAVTVGINHDENSEHSEGPVHSGGNDSEYVIDLRDNMSFSSGSEHTTDADGLIDLGEDDFFSGSRRSHGRLAEGATGIPMSRIFDRASSKQAEDISKAYGNTDSAVTVFNVSSKMVEGDTYEAYLNVFVDRALRAKAFEMREVKIDTVNNHTKTIPYSPWMRARISGLNFIFSDSTATTQLIRVDDITNWKWEVSPNSPDAKELTVTIEAVTGPDAAGHVLYKKLMSQTVKVQTLPLRAIERHWKVVSATVIPAIGAIWTLFTAKRRKRNKKSVSEGLHSKNS